MDEQEVAEEAENEWPHSQELIIPIFSSVFIRVHPWFEFFLIPSVGILAAILVISSLYSALSLCFLLF